MSAQPELSIIIVNWNSSKYLRACMASIFSSHCDCCFEVLVIDNGSHDGCGEMLRRDFPQVRFLQSPQNLGFAVANNRAFAFSTGRNLLFLNPDTELEPGAVQRLLKVLRSAAEAGIVGPRLVGPDLVAQGNCMRAVPTIFNQLLDSSVTRALFPRSWGFDVVALESQAPVSAQVVPGTCLMVRRDVFTAAGLFNPAYFMYAEDVDLCCRARKLGWKTYYLHDAVVIHQGGCSSRLQANSAFSAVLMRESVHKFLAAQRGRAYAAGYGAVTGVAAMCRMLVCSGLWLLARHQNRQRWRTAANKWTRVLRWSLGLEPWAGALDGRSPRATRPASFQQPPLRHNSPERRPAIAGRNV